MCNLGANDLDFLIWNFQTIMLLYVTYQIVTIRKFQYLKINKIKKFF